MRAVPRAAPRFFCALIVILVSVRAARGEATPAAGSLVLYDRVVAVVDDDPILASDIDRALALGLGPQAEGGESRSALRRRVLDALIDEKLRYHEVERVGLGQVGVSEIESQVERIRSSFATEADFQRQLAALQLSEEALGVLVARQLAVLAYVDERLGARIFVSLDDIRAYYDGELGPALRARGQPVPPLEEVRETIRSLLRSRQLNVELERWSSELQRKADIIDLLDSDHSQLPPLVETLTTAPAPP